MIIYTFVDIITGRRLRFHSPHPPSAKVPSSWKGGLVLATLMMKGLKESQK